MFSNLKVRLISLQSALDHTSRQEIKIRLGVFMAKVGRWQGLAACKAACKRMESSSAISVPSMTRSFAEKYFYGTVHSHVHLYGWTNFKWNIRYEYCQEMEDTFARCEWQEGQTSPLMKIFKWGPLSWNLGSVVTLLLNHPVKGNETANMFNCTVKNKFSVLEFVYDDLSNHWAGLKQTWHEPCDKVLGKRVSNWKECLSEESWSSFTQRKCFKQMNGCNEQARKRDLASLYRQLNRDVGKTAWKDKKKFFNTLPTKLRMQ